MKFNYYKSGISYVILRTKKQGIVIECKKVYSAYSDYAW